MRRGWGVAVLVSALVAAGAVFAAPVASAAPPAPTKCVDAVNSRNGDKVARACVEPASGLITVKDEGRPDGLHATGYWSGDGKSGSHSVYGGSGSSGSWSLPVRNRHQVCFRAAAKEHDEIVYLSQRVCVTLDIRVQLP